MRNLVFLICLLFTIQTQQIVAQENGELLPQSAEYYEYLGEGNELLMNVQIWGQVKNPGLYSLPVKSDIVLLLSLAGGPTENADLSKIKIIRKGSTRDSLFVINLKKSLLEGKKNNVVLMPGDIVELSPSKFYSLSNFIRFVTQITMVVAVYYQIFGR